MIRPTCDVDEVHQLLDLDVVLTVSSQDDAAVLNGIATQRKQKVKAHIEIDTRGVPGVFGSDRRSEPDA